MSGVLVVIPARYGSSRFPGKPLADLGGAPLVVRVAQMAARMTRATEIVVATDDERIRAAVAAAGFACEMTGEQPSGTDRVGVIAAGRRAEVVLNLQGDEPFLRPEDLDGLVDDLRGAPGADVATMGHPLADADEWRDPHVVKVLVDRAGYALYFSRAPLPGAFPGPRAAGDSPGSATGSSGAGSMSGSAAGGEMAGWRLALRHVGVYAYRAAALRRFLTLPPAPLEQVEGLEQLRALEHGMRFRVVQNAGRSLGIDTPADLERARRAWEKAWPSSSS
jgi:3-deoxy-manno-octulosonate cytidylyltransferase (CMP-KDO synthetase)